MSVATQITSGCIFLNCIKEQSVSEVSDAMFFKKELYKDLLTQKCYKLKWPLSPLTSNLSATFNVLSTFLHTWWAVVFPWVLVIATTSMFGWDKAMSIAWASSTPASVSIKNFLRWFAIKISLLTQLKVWENKFNTTLNVLNDKRTNLSVYE